MAELYQLRVVVCRISPLVWRRLLVSSETSLAQLHQILQLALDWGGEHLHRFRVHGKDYGSSQLSGFVCAEDARQVPLSRFRLRCGERFRYEYNLSANWHVDIRLESVLPVAAPTAIPRCTGGKRAAPSEDCPGARAYLQRLDQHRHEFPTDDVVIMADAMQRLLDAGGDRRVLGDIDELREATERVEEYYEFQPDRFDRPDTNRRLRGYWEGVRP